MFKSLRQGSKSIVLTIMFGIISLSFIFAFGSGADGCRAVDPSQKIAEYAVLMNGKDRLSLGDYSEKRKDIMIRNRGVRAQGENELNTLVINSLINDYLFLQYANKMNITVTDAERDAFIENIEYFQTDGKFDYNKYKSIVQSYYNTTLVQHEKNTAKALLIDKVQKLLTSPITVSEKEVWDLYAKYNKNATLSYLKVVPTVEVSDLEVANFLKDNEVQVKKYYADKKDKFTHGKEVRASHILIKVDAKTKDADAKKRILEIKKELDGGADFAELAKKSSEGPSNVKGGDLGYFGKGKMVKAFDAKVFSMKKGEVSEPVKTQFGYHLIKLIDTKEPRVDSYDTVKVSITKTLLRAKKRKIALSNLENDLKAKYGEIKTLEELQALYPNSVIKTSKKIFPYSTYIEGIGSSKEMLEDIFKAKKGDLLPKVYKVSDSLIAAQVKDIELPNKEEFEKQKEQMKSTLVTSEKALFLQSWIDEARAKSTIRIDPTYVNKEETKK